MAEELPETSIRRSASAGARAGMVLAGLLLIGAGYLFWSPIQLYPTGAFPVHCGTAISPPEGELARASCGKANDIRAWQGTALVAAAALTALGSRWAFGGRRWGE